MTQKLRQKITDKFFFSQNFFDFKENPMKIFSNFWTCQTYMNSEGSANRKLPYQDYFAIAYFIYSKKIYFLSFSKAFHLLLRQWTEKSSNIFAKWTFRILSLKLFESFFSCYIKGRNEFFKALPFWQHRGMLLPFK